MGSAVIGLVAVWGSTVPRVCPVAGGQLAPLVRTVADVMTARARQQREVARVEALARRLRGPLNETVEVGPLRLDIGARSTTWHGAPVDLTKTEFDLLTELARTPRKVLARGHLLSKVWNLPPEWKADATLTEHVYRLRNKLKGISIVAVRGVGYRLDPEPSS